MKFVNYTLSAFALLVSISVTSCSAPQVQQAEPSINNKLRSEGNSSPAVTPETNQNNLNGNLGTTTSEQPKQKEKVPRTGSVTVSKPASSDTAPTSITMVVSGNKANMRNRPSQKAKKLKTLKKGEEVKILKQQDEWFQVELASGDIGWCHKSVLGQTTKQ